jgi:hydroxymethylbilane synthase
VSQRVIIGTRGSDLALWQANYVRSQLASRFPSCRFEILTIKTTGDKILDTSLSKIGDKGLFTKEIESALLAGDIDLAVHSLKDLPTTLPDGLQIAGVTRREIANDVLIARDADSIAELPVNARVATGSLRRRSQLLNRRPDIKIEEMRGNVPTRIEKFITSDLDAMILAYAGVHRLGLEQHISVNIPVTEMLPAVGQGAIAVEARTDDNELLGLVDEVNHRDTELCTNAERSFLRQLEGGCQVPIGAHAVLENDRLRLDGFVGSLDGTHVIRESVFADQADASSLGERLASICLSLGADALLRDVRNEGRA